MSVGWWNNLAKGEERYSSTKHINVLVQRVWGNGGVTNNRAEHHDIELLS